jgi:ketosteroid isomerase-like protein
MNQDALADRIRRLEDIEAIKQLKAAYCYWVDEGEIDRLMERFTDDAVWDGGPMGRFEGREAIREFLERLPEQLSFALHWVMNPEIHVEGDAATGRWYLLEPCTAARSRRAIWGAGRYEERYVRVAGEWKFREVKLIPLFWTTFDEGWSKRRSVFERS